MDIENLYIDPRPPLEVFTTPGSFTWAKPDGVQFIEFIVGESGGGGPGSGGGGGSQRLHQPPDDAESS